MHFYLLLQWVLFLISYIVYPDVEGSHVGIFNYNSRCSAADQ